jgi:hypothetical protein
MRYQATTAPTINLLLPPFGPGLIWGKCQRLRKPFLYIGQ